MNQSPSVTSPTTSVSLPPPVRPPAVLVMALRAAEQHILVVVGEADMHTAGYLRTQLIDLLRSNPPSVVVELGGLDFCDLAGLDALHDAVRTAQDIGVALTFRGMSAQLAWLHRTFPPGSPVPPPPAPDVAERVPETPASPGGSRQTTARRNGQTGVGEATTRRIQQTAVAAAPGPYLSGRDHSRRGAVDGPLHAVPTSDTTRSAVCGARILRATTSWTGAAHDSCPDCVAALAAARVVGTVHPISAPRPPADSHPVAGNQARVRHTSPMRMRSGPSRQTGAERPSTRRPHVLAAALTTAAPTPASHAL